VTGRILLSGLLIVAAHRPCAAQRNRTGVTFCVTPPDSTWRPIDWGFSTRHESVGRHSGATPPYPVIFDVKPKSQADSVGLRDGDSLVSINGRDARKPYGPPWLQPNVPARLVVQRGPMPFHVTVTPSDGKPCPDSLRRRVP
jgi:hypothetical protein